MARSLRLLLGLAPGPILCAAVAAVLGACATSEPPDLSGGVDPNVPQMNPPRDPMPGNSGSKDGGGGSGEGPAPDPGGGGGDGGGSSGSDAGPSATDGGAADSGVTPPSGQKPTQGEVLITEVMYDGAGAEPASEWFEVYNTASSARTLTGLVIVDGGNRTHVIAGSVTVAAGAYAVLVRDQAAATAAKVPSGAIAYAYGNALPANAGVLLANGTSGSITLKDGATVVAQAAYGGWFGASAGSSVQLKVLTYASSSDKASWCQSANTWGTGSDKGTPGAAADCP